MEAPELNETNAQHLCSCKIVLGGDPGSIVVREALSNPVPWPEVMVLQSMHGEDAVYDIKPVGLMVRGTPYSEKLRMISIYGMDVVDAVYSGRSPSIEFFMPGWPIDPSSVPAKRKKPEKIKPPKVKMYLPHDEEEAAV
jgi:hypothetical protein